jgi:hypothetical protein
MAQITTMPDLNGMTIDPKTIKIHASEARASKDTFGIDISERNTSENKVDREKGSKISNPLIKQLHDAVNGGDTSEPITAHSLTQWMSTFNIRKGDGTKYKNFNAGSFLSSSYIGKKNRTNRNSIWLDRCFNISKGIYGYSFAD